jgi:hypothetical protein
MQLLKPWVEQVRPAKSPGYLNLHQYQANISHILLRQFSSLRVAGLSHAANVDTIQEGQL